MSLRAEVKPLQPIQCGPSFRLSDGCAVLHAIAARPSVAPSRLLMSMFGLTRYHVFLAGLIHCTKLTLLIALVPVIANSASHAIIAICAAVRDVQYHRSSNRRLVAAFECLKNARPG